MNITDVRVRKITDEGKMKCIVSLTFDNLFVVHDIKVIIKILFLYKYEVGIYTINCFSLSF